MVPSTKTFTGGSIMNSRSAFKHNQRTKLPLSIKKTTLVLLCIGYAHAGQAGDVLRDIIMEADPVAPTSSAYEQESSKVSTSKWGLAVDFNTGNLSTGPEIWTGSFLVKGRDGASIESTRREDFWPGERQKIDATRIRWNIGYWQQAQSMRGMYAKVAYNYTKINSRANRYTEIQDTKTGLTTKPIDNPNDETDLITDVRHGVSLGVGSRWFLYERLTASIGASITQNIRRTVDVDSHDDNAEADYTDLINSQLPDTKMSTRPMPEVNMGLGYAF
jgi:hypothetical protein